MKRKSMKKRVLSVLAALVMMMSMVLPAMAATEQAGTLTINGTKEGKEYDLYKVFDLTQEGENYSYTVNENFTAFFEGKGIADPIDYVSKLGENSAELGGFAKDVLTYAIENKVSYAARAEGQDGNTTISLPYGYYLMNPLGAGTASEGNPSVFALGTLSGGKMEITVKTEYPELDKKVDEATVNEASVGDTVNFKLTTKVPDMTGYTKYFMVVKDVMSKGLAFQDDVVIKVGEITLTADDFTVYKSGNDEEGTELQIVFKDAINMKDLAGTPIEIAYTAVLTQYAEAGATANENSANLIYSNDPTVEGTGNGTPIDPENPTPDPDLPGEKDPTGETPVSTTETFTTQITISKVDGTGKVLTGAGFTLTSEDGAKVVVVTSEGFAEASDGTYKQLEDGSYALISAGEAYEGTRYNKTTTTTVKGENQADTTISGMVDENGQLVFKGLGTGTYTISETTVPNGYNKCEDITFTVTFDADKKEFSSDNENVTLGGNVFVTTITNLSGSLLPETGGMGTTLFTIGGIILMIAAVVLFITKRKASSRS